LFAFSLLFTGVCAVLAAEGENFWALLLAALLTAVLNGVLTGILFSLPACRCFSSQNEAVPTAGSVSGNGSGRSRFSV
jgi:hypothetical protein